MIATVVKIKKKYRNGEHNLFLVLLDRYEDTSDLEYLIEEKCEQDTAGRNYGYSYDYQILKRDDKEYKIALLQEIDKHHQKMVSSNYVINELNRLL